ncbi:MAG: hypothetical protein IPP57_09080 [Candidatus Obscuribacter sp.]|nr:hypothetical protein [Candidatus Obscuribacter sp.]MBK9770961.1 hypothetical protein [Candidatus Obscuribacter sp.]MBL0186499.1 hypothetical protein [Candidatus Obscuribacter sp.]
MNTINEAFVGTVWSIFNGNAYTRIKDGNTLCLHTEHYDGATIAVKLWLLTSEGWTMLHKISEGINNPGFYHDPLYDQKRLDEVKEKGNLVRSMMDYAALLYGDRLCLPDHTQVSQQDYDLVPTYRKGQTGQ